MAWQRRTFGSAPFSARHIRQQAGRAPCRRLITPHPAGPCAVGWTMSNSSVDLASAARKLLPILDLIPAYRREWLLPDVLAGVALWAVMVPKGMAYAGIVGVPPIMGLYTIVPALLAYALLGTSRQLVVGPDTATGLISALSAPSQPRGRRTLIRSLPPSLF